MALVAPNKHEIMHIKNLVSTIQMQKLSITDDVRQCYILILQFEENHQKDDNDLFMIDALEFYTLHNELKETLAELGKIFLNLI